MTAASTRIAGTTTRGAGTTSRRRDVGWLGLAPFWVYVALFLGLPTALAVASGFFTSDGAFTFANLAAFADPGIQADFLNSFWVSAVSAAISAVLGAVICWALTATSPSGLLRTVVDAASSVLAQFGGVMLAFAWIATIGAQGLLSVALRSLTGFDLNGNGPVLYQVGGLLFPYTYFGVPLMVLTFMPALEGLRPQWGEAAAILGAGRPTYWVRVAAPILAPAFLGSLILLFANAFSSYATAAALIDQGGIVPLAIRQQLTSETVVGVQNVAGVLALGMVVVMAVLMTGYALVERRARRWQA